MSWKIAILKVLGNVPKLELSAKGKILKEENWLKIKI